MSQRDYKLVPFCVHGCQITQDRYLFSILREPSVDRKDLQALTLMVLTRDNPVLDPLAVLHRLYITKNLCFLHLHSDCSKKLLNWTKL